MSLAPFCDKKLFRFVTTLALFCDKNTHFLAALARVEKSAGVHPSAQGYNVESPGSKTESSGSKIESPGCNLSDCSANGSQGCTL